MLTLDTVQHPDRGLARYSSILLLLISGVLVFVVFSWSITNLILPTILASSTPANSTFVEEEPVSPLTLSAPTLAKTLPSAARSANPASVATAPIESDDWSGVLTARRPTLNEIRGEVPISIWNFNLITPADILQPGKMSYSGSVDVDKEYLYPVYWCALSADVLNDGIDNMLTKIVVNGEVVPDKYILTYEYDTSTGWKCTYSSVVLGGWVVNQKYKLETRRTFLVEINDGRTRYPAGDYVYELNLDVR